MSEEQAVPRRDVPPEDEERGRYTEGGYGERGAAAEVVELLPGEGDYSAGEYPDERESARENEPEGNDPDIAVRPPDE